MGISPASRKSFTQQGTQFQNFGEKSCPGLSHPQTGLAFLKHSKQTYTATDLQSVQMYEEKIAEALAVLDTNLRISEKLNSFYEKLLYHTQFSLAQEVRQATLDFSTQLQNIRHDFEGQQSRAQRLLNIVKLRKTLVRTSRRSG